MGWRCHARTLKTRLTLAAALLYASLASAADEMAFTYPNAAIAESQLDRINRSVVQTQCTLGQGTLR